MQGAQAALTQAGAAQPGAATQFMNPYEDQVVQQTLADIRKAGQEQQNQLSSQAVQAGALADRASELIRQHLVRLIYRNSLEQQPISGSKGFNRHSKRHKMQRSCRHSRPGCMEL